jgi:hypothetical protein
LNEIRMPVSEPDNQQSERRGANVRTALILLSIAVVFFGGIIASQYTGGNVVGIGVLGLAIIGFLLITVGRKLRGDASKTRRG